MGDRLGPRRPMAWQRTLGEMRQHGTRLAQCCTQRTCGRWHVLDVASMIETYGEAWAPWDHFPLCPRCGVRGHYMAAPGDNATPFRPLVSSYSTQIERQTFLRSFGFTRRDVARIQAHAERVAAGAFEAGLQDLDVPVRVQALQPGWETRSSGDFLGDWAGMTLMFWRLEGREKEAWRRRPRAARPV